MGTPKPQGGRALEGASCLSFSLFMDYLTCSQLVENKDWHPLPGCLSLSASVGLGLLRGTQEVPQKIIALMSLEF